MHPATIHYYSRRKKRSRTAQKLKMMKGAGNREPPQDRGNTKLTGKNDDQNKYEDDVDVDVGGFLKALESRQATLMSRMEQTQDLISSIRHTRDYDSHRSMSSGRPMTNPDSPAKYNVAVTPRRSGGEKDSKVVRMVTIDSEGGTTLKPPIDFLDSSSSSSGKQGILNTRTRTPCSINSNSSSNINRSTPRKHVNPTDASLLSYLSLSQTSLKTDLLDSPVINPSSYSNNHMITNMDMDTGRGTLEGADALDDVNVEIDAAYAPDNDAVANMTKKVLQDLLHRTASGNFSTSLAEGKFCTYSYVAYYRLHALCAIFHAKYLLDVCLLVLEAEAGTSDTNNDAFVGNCGLKKDDDLANVIAESIIRGSIDEDGEAQILAFAHRVILKVSKHYHSSTTVDMEASVANVGGVRKTVRRRCVQGGKGSIHVCDDTGIMGDIDTDTVHATSSKSKGKQAVVVSTDILTNWNNITEDTQHAAGNPRIEDNYGDYYDVDDLLRPMKLENSDDKGGDLEEASYDDAVDGDIDTDGQSHIGEKRFRHRWGVIK